MAEFAAHLNSQSPQSLTRHPSIFEVVAQESLLNGLRKAFHHVIQILWQNYPEKCSRLYVNFDEFYLLLDLLVEFSHLRAFSASFSEHFYGLKRISCNSLINDPKSKLTARQFYSSLILLIGIPYIRVKLKKLYERLKFAHLEGRINDETHSNQILFLKIYPVFFSTLELISLLHQITFAVGTGKYHSPLLRLASVKLIQDDFDETLLNTVTLDSNLSWFRYLRRASWLTTKWVANGLGAALSVGAFFIQFLDFWYTRENTPPSFAPLPIPPPPARYPIEIPYDVCPICLHQSRNETALSTTGFVFCYSCIRNYVLQNNRCPVTGYPSSLQHLVKLYPPDN